MKRFAVFCTLAATLLALFASAALRAQPAAAQLVESGPTAPIGDVANGIIIFQQRCANCHGAAGLGDGEMAAQLPNMPTAIGSPDYILNAVPSAMFDVVTNGRIERGMPLFGEGSSNPLSEQQRWDVISALYALGTQATDLRAGGALVDAALRARLAAVNWTTTTNQAVATGLGDSELSADERLAVANWGRLALAANYFLPQGTISGVVSNGSTSTPLAATEVTLRAFEGFGEVQTWTTTTDDAGVFAFDLQEIPADWVLFAGLTYADLAYTSDFAQMTADSPAAALDITVYDATTDAAGIALDRLHTIVEIGPASLVVNAFYAYSNRGNSVYTGPLLFRLPEGAQDVAFNTMSAMGQFAPAPWVVPLPDGYQATRPLRPGSNALALLVSYALPYDGRSATIRHALEYQPDSMTLIAPNGLTIGGGWTQQELTTIDGTTYATYTGTPGNTLEVAISGTSQFAVDPQTGQRILLRDPQRDLLIGSAALAAVLVVCAVVVRAWRNQPPADPGPLLVEIAALDDAHAAREIPRAAYEQRRKRLLQELRDIWPDGETP